MSEPVLSWWSSDGSAVADPLSLAPVAGIATDAVALRLYNDKDGTAGSIDASELALSCMTCDQGSGLYSFDDDVASNGWMEVRLVTNAVPGPWMAIGKNRWALLPDLAAEAHHVLEFRANVPVGPGTSAKDLVLVPRYRETSEPLADGFLEVAAAGIVLGIGDSEESWLAFGGDIAPSGSPDDKVTVSARGLIASGAPAAALEEEVTLDQNDADAVALAAGELYVAGLTVAADGSVTATKSPKATAPWDPTNDPALPDEPFLGWVQVDYDAGGGAIGAGDIDQTARVFGAFALETSPASLSATVHPGRSISYGRRVVIRGKRAVSFGASVTSTVWLTPGAALVVNTTGLSPIAGSFPVYLVTTDGSGVTAVVDRRPFVSGRIVPVSMTIIDPAASDVVHWQSPFDHPLYLIPGRCMRMELHDDPATLAAVSGSWVGDVAVLDAGSAWSTLFPSFGTDDQRPTIPHDATARHDDSAIPEVLTIGPRGILRFEVAAIATGGTPASGITLSMLLVSF